MDTSGKTGDLIHFFNTRTGRAEDIAPVIKTDAEWRAQLTPEQYIVARKQGTEYAFTGKYHVLKEHGIYACICCGPTSFYRTPSLIPAPAGPVSLPPYQGSTSVPIPIPRAG